jgi:poly(A) polymerase
VWQLLGSVSYYWGAIESPISDLKAQLTWAPIQVSTVDRATIAEIPRPLHHTTPPQMPLVPQNNMNQDSNYNQSTSGGKTEDSHFSSPPPEDVAYSYRVEKTTFPKASLDFDALKVVNRLTRFGYEAYLVGGCVRDILFGKQPKDFDVATSAQPQEIKKLFRNCRLIGRRFRLAHLLFRGKIIEVATFRRSPNSGDDITNRHAAENLFGGPADDAIRRDFTINALMYDAGRERILDYVNGLTDIKSRTLNTIGNPDRRFPEDPVRIIRAVKFAKRLDLVIGPDLLNSLKFHSASLGKCSPSRLVEEMFKVLQSRSSAECMKMLLSIGVLDTLLPTLSKKARELPTTEDAWAVLKRLDDGIIPCQSFPNSLMLAALAYPFCRMEMAADGDVSQNVQEAVSNLFRPMTFPKRQLAQTRQILVAQRRLLLGPTNKRAVKLLDRDYAANAISLMMLTCDGGGDRRTLEAWLNLEHGRRSKRAPNSKTGHSRTRRRRPRNRTSDQRTQS